MIRATVLIPTHVHVGTLPYAILSAREQTVSDIEIFVVGDGAPPRTREIVESAMKEDPRIVYFENPKGTWQGEEHRHRALCERARGRIVTYLSDDDLYLPDHVEAMEGALESADFAGCLPLRVHPDGTFDGWACDLEVPRITQDMMAGINHLPLSCGAHTMEAYRRLPVGWSPASPSVWSDLLFWQKFVGLPGARLKSVHRPTVLHFPQEKHGGWVSEDQWAVLGHWLGRIRTLEGRMEILYRTVKHLAAEWAKAYR